MLRRSSAAILVPSDVTIAENKFSSGRRRLTITERVGLATMFPLWRRHYVKNTSKDVRSILTKGYNSVKAKDDEEKKIIEILQTRQQHVHNMMVTRAFGFYGLIGLPILVNFSLRHYDHKGQIVPFPFAAYGGNLLGRALASCFTGRWSSPLRTVSLGNLPARVFLRPEEADCALSS